MRIGDRLRKLRKKKNFSQGDIEKRTGLLRSYISRVENGHTVPSVQTLEKLTRALDIPLYQFFFEGNKAPEPPHLRRRKAAEQIALAEASGHPRFFRKLMRALRRMGEKDRQLLLHLAEKMASR